MKPTPERAIELAERFDLDRGRGSLPTPAIVHDPVAAEIAAILRHYAEIATKYQAVLDAEPVELDRYSAGLLGGDRACTVDWWHDYIRCEIANAHDYCQSQIDSLIIKPTP